jgi:dipeptide transport system substrate-binding protein
VLLSCDKDGKPNAQNVAKWCNADFNAAVSKAVELTDKEERTKLYQDAQKIHHDQVGWLDIAHSTVYEPVRKTVQGYKISPFGAHEFQNVDITE